MSSDEIVTTQQSAIIFEPKNFGSSNYPSDAERNDISESVAQKNISEKVVELPRTARESETKRSHLPIGILSRLKTIHRDDLDKSSLPDQPDLADRPEQARSEVTVYSNELTNINDSNKAFIRVVKETISQAELDELAVAKEQLSAELAHDGSTSDTHPEAESVPGEDNTSEEGKRRFAKVLLDNIKNTLRDATDRQRYVAYIEPLQVVSFDAILGRLVLGVPSKFVRSKVEEDYLDQITNCSRKLSGMGGITIALEIVEPKKGDYVVVAPQPSVRLVPRPSVDPRLKAGISPRYTFANFVVGSSNQFCHAAAMSVAEAPGKRYNPFFIYGGVGLGKTHLLHAIANAVLEANPHVKVLYMSSETFTNELIMALRHGKMDEFKHRMRSIELLLIDDIQFMSGKERTQEEFFHTFNALYGAKFQIVVTSDKLPQDIVGLEDRLKTRFSWGLTADLQAPDFETRVAILKRKAQVESCPIPEEVAHYIAGKISANVRELEGALTNLHAASSLEGKNITLEFTERVLRPLLGAKHSQAITLDSIKAAVAAHFHLRVGDMISKKRTKNLSFPRHIAMYLARKHTTHSYPEIGEQFGGRDHSSVIHASNVVAKKLKEEAALRVVIEGIEKQVIGV